jgi:hypothetical protein
MRDLARFLYVPVMIIVAVMSSRRWPGAMREVSRGLAAANGLVILCIMATGWIHSAGPAGAIHRWLPHGLFIVDWSAIPLAVGVALARSRRRPIAAAARAIGILTLSGAIFLASITGYLGPSYGPIDPMSFRRFQVLHYWVFPSLAIALVSWWYLSSALTDPAG